MKREEIFFTDYRGSFRIKIQDLDATTLDELESAVSFEKNSRKTKLILSCYKARILECTTMDELRSLLYSCVAGWEEDKRRNKVE